MRAFADRGERHPDYLYTSRNGSPTHRLTHRMAHRMVHCMVHLYTSIFILIGLPQLATGHTIVVSAQALQVAMCLHGR